MAEAKWKPGLSLGQVTVTVEISSLARKGGQGDKNKIENARAKTAMGEGRGRKEREGRKGSSLIREIEPVTRSKRLPSGL